MAKFATYKFEVLIFVSFLLLIGCASIQQPTGGPKDTKPPKVVKETPKNLTTKFSAKTIQIEFDEFIKLNNEFTEVSISPAMDKMPTLKARKEMLEIKFDQALDSNTTYTINFGKAIVDVNEGNVIKNYSYVFSTGNVIDSLSISGTVRSSTTKDSLLDATVFIIPVKQDSIFGKKRANIFTSTDSAGKFTLRNLREDDYLLYALKEESIDRIYNGAKEEIGFNSDTIHLSKNISDLQLNVFQQLPEIFAVTERKIENTGRIVLSFNKPLTDASVSILSPAALVKANKTVEITAGKDSALLWLPDLTFDSIKVAVTRANKPVDTVQITRSKRDTYNRAVTVTDDLTSGKLKPGTDPLITLSSPIASVQNGSIQLLADSVAVSGIQVIKDTTSTRQYRIKYAWRANREYILKLGENAFTDVFGNKSKASSKTFSLDSEENYGTIALNVSVPDTGKTYIIEWLNSQDVVLRSDVISKDTTINYVRYPTAKYKVRVVYDINKNGIWDTGSIKLRRQPETIWNYSKEITLRPNWDLEEKLVIPKNL